MLLVVALGYYEFCEMFRQTGRQPFLLLGLGLVLLVVATSKVQDREYGLLAVLAVLMVTLGYALLSPRRPAESVTNWTITVAGVLYIGWLMRYGVLLRDGHSGWEWSVLAVLGTWAADTGAYLVGRAIGRHKLSMRISPGKTWEGVFGGFACTVVVTLVIGLLMLQLAIWVCLASAVLITVFGLFGDLAESLLKRAVGVKDSSGLIPGHGGMLDRMDSLLFVLPVVYYVRLLSG
jgi:phosphatidate cytidylyltransferase